MLHFPQNLPELWPCSIRPAIVGQQSAVKVAQSSNPCQDLIGPVPALYVSEYFIF